MFILLSRGHLPKNWKSKAIENPGPRGRGVYSAVARPFREFRQFTMIAVTRLNGKSFVVNAALIRYIESTPDTMITLMGGEKVIVKEPLEEVVERAIQYNRKIRMFDE